MTTEAPAATETPEAILERLIVKPGTADVKDVEWLVKELTSAKLAVLMLKEGDGRFYGLREAAELVEMAALKDVKVRHLGVGKKEQVSRAINEKLLYNVAGIIRRYADDQEAGVGPDGAPLVKK